MPVPPVSAISARFRKEKPTILPLYAGLPGVLAKNT
jgi:hypothetical protein